MVKKLFSKSTTLIALCLILCGFLTAAHAAPYATNMMPPFSIKTSETTPKTVYIQVRNTSGTPAPFLHLSEAITTAFETYNYTVVKNPNEAYYVIHATMPQAGEITQLQLEMLLALGYGKTNQEPLVPEPIVTTPTSEISDTATADGDTAETTIPDTTATLPSPQEGKDKKEMVLDNSPLLWALTFDMQISIQQPQGKRVRYQVRLTTATPKTNTSFETISPELSKHLADGVVGIFKN